MIKDLQIACSVNRTSGFAIAVYNCEYYNIENIMLFRHNQNLTGNGLFIQGGIGFIKKLIAKFLEHLME